MKKLTSDQAVDQLVHKSHQDMYELCRLAHKSLYDYYGDNILARYTRKELVNWYILHHQWNDKIQRWQKNKIKEQKAA